MSPWNDPDIRKVGTCLPSVPCIYLNMLFRYFDLCFILCFKAKPDYVLFFGSLCYITSRCMTFIDSKLQLVYNVETKFVRQITRVSGDDQKVDLYIQTFPLKVIQI